ncbi:DUF6484 domain-containing protein [Aliikangiella coralliicola]|uniref:DUF6484 domain-containing protein n=1 Tax=Aliikangiella coralliicola TaxID=2592383 RepID=UPI001AEFC625|nr:DUF6484 domain-containing protein [Aliikangiella coralliicola]
MSNQSESFPEQTSSLDYETTKTERIIAPGEIVIGELLGFNENGEPQVKFPGAAETALTAISTVAVTHEHKGRRLALLFADGDLSKPVIMGLIHSPLLDILNNVEFVPADEPADRPAQLDDDLESKESNSETDNAKEPDEVAYIDGERVVLEGKEEITLKCGEASITLTKAGKILIRGKYLLNRSTGVNRIMGGSVQVN